MPDLDIASLIACNKCFGNLAQEGLHVRCLKCQSVFDTKDGIFYFTKAKHSPSIRQNARDKKRWTLWRRQNFEYLQKKLKSVKSGSLVLDVGAGQSHFKEAFDSYKYVGVDFCPYEDVSVVADIITKLPFRENTFDLIVLSNVLEHVPEPLVLLKECFRVLKSAGHIIILVPFVIRLHQSPYDFLRYTHYMLDYLLERAGFVKIEIQKIGSVFEILDLLVTSSFSVYLSNLRQKISNRYMRAVPQIMLLACRKIVVFLLFISKKLFHDSMDIPREERLPHGYGVVAVK